MRVVWQQDRLTLRSESDEVFYLTFAHLVLENAYHYFVYFGVLRTRRRTHHFRYVLLSYMGSSNSPELHNILNGFKFSADALNCYARITCE